VRRLVYLESANRDLGSIQDYITRQSRNLAIGQGFAAALRGQCRKLARLPGTLGRPRPESRPDLRSFPFKGYVIFFRYRGDDFEVVAILEAHRDVAAYFDDPAT